MKARCYDRDFRYVPVKDQGPDYLKRKFDAMRRTKRRNEAEVKAKVKPLERKCA